MENAHFVAKWRAAKHAAIAANACVSRDQAIARGNMIEVFRNINAGADPQSPSGAASSRSGGHSKGPITPPRVSAITAASTIAPPQKRG